jgi:hypothetical protein
MHARYDTHTLLLDRGLFGSSDLWSAPYSLQPKPKRRYRGFAEDSGIDRPVLYRLFHLVLLHFRLGARYAGRLPNAGHAFVHMRDYFFPNPVREPGSQDALFPCGECFFSGLLRYHRYDDPFLSVFAIDLSSFVV